jgi:hypothetical protein
MVIAHGPLAIQLARLPGGSNDADQPGELVALVGRRAARLMDMLWGTVQAWPLIAFR